MTIRIYNTLTKTKEDFIPVDPNGRKVGIYLCGPTVYKPSHIGHMVGPVIFDAIKRYLTYSGYEVTFIINVTDVDDKLIAEANARGVSMAAVADEMLRDYQQNLAALGVLESITSFPKATEYISEIIAFTQDLINLGFAYVSTGDVYFNVEKFAEYGKLSQRTLEQMLGEGGDTAERKQSRCDFALWKSAKAGEPSWESPWGAGRPGWHIECSVMSRALLGKTFDIHAGGLDLVFPHHENEVAQSESCHGQPMAKYWMHNGLMQSSQEVGKVGGRHTREAAADDFTSQDANKISKSRGSSPFRELLKLYDAETIRFFLLSSHYRRPIDYSPQRLDEVGKGLAAFYRFFERFAKTAEKSFYDLQVPKTRVDSRDSKNSNATNHDTETAQKLRAQFLAMMDDDFNTGGAVGILFEFLRHLNKIADEVKDETGKNEVGKKNLLANLLADTILFRELTSTLGLFLAPRPLRAEAASDSLAAPLMEIIITLRQTARKNKDFTAADYIRDSLAKVGITLKDAAGETTWERG